MKAGDDAILPGVNLRDEYNVYKAHLHMLTMLGSDYTVPSGPYSDFPICSNLGAADGPLLAGFCLSPPAAMGR